MYRETLVHFNIYKDREKVKKEKEIDIWSNDNWIKIQLNVTNLSVTCVMKYSSNENIPKEDKMLIIKFHPFWVDDNFWLRK